VSPGDRGPSARREPQRGHAPTRVNFAERPYDPWLAYGQSKTANVLFAVAATRRWSGEGITCNESPVLQSPSRDDANGVAAYAVDPVNAERLWQLSERTL
jgi:hypothetical protein